MSIKLMSAIWPLEMDSTPKFVLISLADQANDDGECWPSVANLSKRTGLSERTVQYAIKQLVGSGYVETIQRAGRSTVFRVCTPANDAPPKYVHPRNTCTPPPQPLHPTPATIAPGGATGAPRTQKNRNGTVKEPKRALPDWLPETEWNAFVEMRRGGRGKFTAHAQDLAIAKLDDLRRQGYPPADVLNQSVLRGWTGLFPIKAEGNSNGTQRFNPRESMERAVEQIRASRGMGAATVGPDGGDVRSEVLVPVSRSR